MSTRTKLTLIAALAAAGVASAAHAAPATTSSDDSNTASVRVSLKSLGSNNPADAKIVLQRIRSAAEDVCGPAPGQWTIYVGVEYRACVADSVNRAVASLHNPIMTALNAGQGQSSTVLAANAR